jgi:hypothetical protein
MTVQPATEMKTWQVFIQLRNGDTMGETEHHQGTGCSRGNPSNEWREMAA